MSQQDTPKTAIILAAGKGTKMWPYGELRPKCLLPVANQPVIEHQVQGLRANGVTRIVIAANHHCSRIRSLFRSDPDVEIVDVGETHGTAESLLGVATHINSAKFWVVYGDIWIHEKDIAKLGDLGDLGALVVRHEDRPGNYIGCSLFEGHLESIIGHSREKTSHHFVGFAMHTNFLHYVATVPNFFPSVDVGMMVPNELHLEAALVNMMRDQIHIPFRETERSCFDLDKPWQLLAANSFSVKERCEEIIENQLHAGATIDPSATINGFIRLGKNSHIGTNVIIEGNCWVGDNTHITNGAFLTGNIVIGNHCEIGYGCYIAPNSSIGDYSKVLHGAELSGVLFENVYLYHYMEIAGIVGENSDIGAGTVCGSLRFDDGLVSHRVKGRYEVPRTQELANGCYIGDQCRTGVNAIILPGRKIGSGSIIGPGVIVSEDLESNKLLSLKQEQVKKDWNPDKYGW